MGIRKLFFETAAILTMITLLVVMINSFQTRRNASHVLNYLQEQYLNATYEIYKNEIIGDVLVGNQDITMSLLKEISQSREVGAILTYDKNELSTGTYPSHVPTYQYKLNLGNEKFAQLKLYPLKNLNPFNFFDELMVPLFLEIVVLAMGFLWLLRRIRQKLLNPLKDLVLNLDTGYIEKFDLKEGAVLELKELCSTLKKMNIEIRKKAQFEAESMAAKQVAHDIRSPLACLNLLLSYTTSLPEKQRILVRSSVQRITDIANVLQSKAKQIISNTSDLQHENIMVSSIVELLVTEKRMQLGLSSNVTIDLDLDNAYGLFSNVNPTECKRVLSNLINNSLEAFDDNAHHVYINISHSSNEIIISIDDDGHGIPDDILAKVGTYGFSYGKENLKNSGSGLGLHHAIKTINSFNGKLTIQSQISKGTHVKISLPKSEAPKWFVKEIELGQIKMIAILDDDESIHHLWRHRLEKCDKYEKIQTLHFSSAIEFKQYMMSGLELPIDNLLFLIDYELVNQNVNGIDLIEQFNLNKNAILVTSHHDDMYVQAKATLMKISIIPKGIVTYVPIR